MGSFEPGGFLESWDPLPQDSRNHDTGVCVASVGGLVGYYLIIVDTCIYVNSK